MKLYICDSKGEMLKITIEPQKTISELKDKIKELKYVKDEIILCFNGNMLENSKTIEESNLNEENILSFLGNFVPHKLININKNN